MFFDRNLRSDENLYLNLQELREGEYQSVGNNILSGSTSPFERVGRRWRYRYNRDRNRIGNGRYRIEIGGYDQSTNSPTCLIVPIPGGFPITLPDPVDFTVEKNNDQLCHGTNTGSIEITDVSGGSGTYSYSLDNGNSWSTTFQRRDLPLSINSLSPNRYQVQVRDSNNCLARESDNIRVKTISISIDRAIQVAHTVGSISLPSSNTGVDGIINIESIRGGVPFTDRLIPYYRYQVLIDGEESNIQTYTDVATNNGYQISRLPVGSHIVRYTDANNCITDVALPEIVNPVAITDVTITEQIACFGGVARVEVTATGGASGTYDYALWNGTPILESDWQSSRIFLLNASRVSGYRFVARDRIVTNFISSESTPALTIDQPTQIRIRTLAIDHNTVFNGSEGAISIGVDGGNSTRYTINWERNGELISNTGIAISNLLAGRYVAIVLDGSNCEMRSDEIIVNQPDELLVSVVVATPIACYGGVGTLSAEVTGGLPIGGRYQYQWFRDDIQIDSETSSTLSDVIQGNYSVRVADRFTSNTASVTFTQPDVLNLSIVRGDNISCYNQNNGRIILDPQGGTRPYSFSIDDRRTYISEADLTDFTLENLASGDYEVWLRDANDCEITTPQSITLIQPEEIVINPVAVSPATTIGGTNGSFVIEVTGGTGEYRYSWTKDDDDTFTRTTKDIDNLSVGAYTVVITDANDCSQNRTFQVVEPDPMVVNIEIVHPILCYGDSLGRLQAIVMGGFPIESTPSDFEYRWYRIEDATSTLIDIDISQDSIDNLPSGQYRVVTTDITGVSSEATIELGEPDDLVVTLSSSPTQILCNGEDTGAIDITVVGGPVDEDTGAYLPYRFRWTKVEDPDFLATTEDLENITAGTYEVVVIDDNSCTTTLGSPVVIEQPDAGLEIYEVNPVNLTGFKTGNGSISVEVRGGTIPYTYSWINSEDVTYSASTQDIEDLSIGIYTLEVKDANNCVTAITQEITEPNQLIVEIIPISEEEGIQCFGEETQTPLTTTTRGGIGSYTYEWFEQENPTEVIFTTPTTTRVRAGVYRVVVTDENGNTDDYVYEVTEPEELSITESVNNLMCRGEANGNIDIMVSGGVEPYSYRWSNGAITEDISSLRAGNYAVVVTDANHCQLQREITITQPPALFVDGPIERVLPSSDSTRDGSITVTIGGGSLPYTYAWRNLSGELQSSTTNVLNNVGNEVYSLTITDDNGCVLLIDNVDLFETPVLQVDIQEVNVISCFGSSSGSLSAIVEGGQPFSGTKQYNYQWFDADDNTLIGLDQFLLEDIPGGNYYVMVSDALGTEITSDVFVLTQPDVLRLSFEADYVNCGDGDDWAITPQISGGTAPFTYQWNDGSTTEGLENVTAGTYSVEVTDIRGCSVMEQITIDIPDPLTITESLTLPTCYNGCDGIIDITIQGGVAPYTYQWSNSATQEDLTGVCAGTYTVIVTDAKGCQTRRDITLGNPDELIIDLGEDVTLCFEQTIVLNATINDPNARYQWTSTNGLTSNQPAIEVSEAGIYDVLIIDSKGCEASDSIFVDTTSEVISANFIASTQVFAGERFVIVDNSDPLPDAINWIFPDEAEVIYEDDNYAELTFEAPGEYEIILQTQKGLCTKETAKTVIVVEKEIEGEEGEEINSNIQNTIDYLVYPNPTPTGRFTVNVNLSKPQPINLKVFNMINNTVIDSRRGEGNGEYIFEYDMSILQSGVYFLLLETSSASQVRKILIQ